MRTHHLFGSLFIAVLGGVLAVPAAAQAPTAASSEARSTVAAPAMRTRLLSSLTGYEIETYLKRNDVIYVPVGPTEVHGGMPVDVEYVIPLAYAIKLAEKSDGLVLPYLAYFYPGSTTVSRATVLVSPSEGLAYLKPLARSLIRQGFHRIVFITAHGPSGDTMQPLVREMFDETHVPVIWLDSGVLQRAAAKATGPRAALGSGGEPPPPFNRLAYGAYLAVGRLNDIPTGLTQPKHDVPAGDGPRKLMSIIGPGDSKVGGFYGDGSQHGGWVTPITEAERTQYATEGLAMINEQVAAFDAVGMLKALDEHVRSVKELEKRYGDLLPSGPNRTPGKD